MFFSPLTLLNICVVSQVLLFTTTFGTNQTKNDTTTTESTKINDNDLAIIIALIVVFVSLITALILLYCFCWKPSNEKELTETDRNLNSPPKKVNSIRSELEYIESAPPSPPKNVIGKELQFENKSEETMFFTLKTELQKNDSDLLVESSEQPPTSQPSANDETIVKENPCPSALPDSTTPLLVKDQPAPTTSEKVTPVFESPATNQTESPGSTKADLTSALLANEAALTAISVDDLDVSKNDAVSIYLDIPTSNAEVDKFTKSSQFEKSDSKSEPVQKSVEKSSSSFKTPKLLDPVMKLDYSKFSNIPKNSNSDIEKKTPEKSTLVQTCKISSPLAISESDIDSLKTDMSKEPVKFVKPVEEKTARPILTISAPKTAVVKTNQIMTKALISSSKVVEQKNIAESSEKKTSMEKLPSFESQDSIEKVNSGTSLSPNIISSITSVPSATP